MARTRRYNGQRYEAFDDQGQKVVVQEIREDLESSAMNRPTEWIRGNSEFRRVDTSGAMNTNAARTEFTDVQSGRIYRVRS